MRMNESRVYIYVYILLNFFLLKCFFDKAEKS